MSCGTTRDRVAQALLRDAGDVLPVDQDAAGLHVVEALQQREQGRLAGSRRADQADALARHEAQVQVLEDLLALAVAELDCSNFTLAPRRTSGVASG